MHYGTDAGGTVEVGTSTFTFRGGYKFAADYEFSAHERGTLLTYRAHNVAPASHRDKALVRPSSGGRAAADRPARRAADHRQAPGLPHPTRTSSTTSTLYPAMAP